MARFRLRVTRYPDVLHAIEQQLAASAGTLTCTLGAGRVYLVLRDAGATRCIRRGRDIPAS